jgi:hypothetical protein
LTIRVRVDEVENDKDEQDAIDAIHRAGCRRVAVVHRDRDDESIVLRFELPQGMNLADVRAACPDVCF